MELEERLGLITKKEVMEILKTSTSTVDRLVKKGVLKQVRLGDDEEIIRYLKHHVIDLAKKRAKE
jgi:predicted DNA-binding transcriptional regulator AlpA